MLTKRILFLLMFCCTTSAIIYAQSDETSYSKLNNVFNLKVTDNSEKLNVEIKGDVRIADDDKSIKSISNDGYVSYRKKNQSLKINADKNGNLSYTINGDKKSIFTDDDKALISDCVKLMINYGVDADNRVKRIYEQKGTAGVLNEVSAFKSDYVKEIYLSYLLKGQKLSSDEMIALLNKTDEYLTSDYYKAELLDGVMASFLKNEATSNAYLKTVSNINSDYYQSSTIQKLLNTSLTERQSNEVLAIVNKMKSDYYQSEILKTLLSNNAISAAKFSDVMKVVASMKSDYYKSEIVNTLLKNKSLSNDRYTQTIAVMQNMTSDYYQYSILSNLIDENVKDEAEWTKLIQYSTKINSDYYQAEMLVKIADKMPDSEALRKELGEAAKKIHSDYYYGMVMRALQKSA